jgi:sugar lactone lactonase YvrE
VEPVARDLEPNGIALAPDGRTPYATHRRSLVAIAIGAGRSIGARTTVFSLRHVDGRLDGVALHRAGNLLVASSIGVLVPSPAGTSERCAPTCPPRTAV